jgi:NitT/TauT family transport system ATP-binding protein
MQRLLIDVLRTAPATVVFVTHDVDEALLLGDRVAVLTAAGITELVDVPHARDPQARGAAAVAAARGRVLAALNA